MELGNVLAAIAFVVALGYLTRRLLPRILALFQAGGLYSSLRGKHVVVTGGSSGIDYSIAEHALKEGALRSVTLIARNMDKLQKAKASLIQTMNCLPGDVHVKSADVRDAAAITAAIRDAQERMPIDVLVCNAGVVFVGRLDEVSAAELEETVGANLLGTVYPIHAAIPLMKSRCSSDTPQSILLVSSVAGLFHVHPGNVYSATKYAQRGLAESLRWELLPFNIHIHVLCPGFVNTPMLQDGLWGDGVDAELCEIYEEINFLDPRHVSTASYVAKCAWEGVKRGSFLITTDWVGHLFAVVGRGPVPEDSIASSILDLFLIIPARLFSFVLKRILKRKIMQLISVPTHAKVKL